MSRTLSLTRDGRARVELNANCKHNGGVCLDSSGRDGGTRVRLRRPRLRAAAPPSRARWETLARFLSLATSRFESPHRARNQKGPIDGALFMLVGAVGLEPTILSAEDFKSPAYANSATPP